MKPQPDNAIDDSKFWSWKVETGDIVEFQLADGKKVVIEFGDASRKKRRLTCCVPQATEITVKTLDNTGSDRTIQTESQSDSLI